MRSFDFIKGKIYNAFENGTLGEKVRHHIISRTKRPFNNVLEYFKIPAKERSYNLKKGFSDHRNEANHLKSNPDDLRRISEAFKRSKKAESQLTSAFEIKGIWKEQINLNFRSLTDAMKNCDVDRMAQMFENLFREPFTNGLGGIDNYQFHNSFTGSLYTSHMLSRYKTFLKQLDIDLTDLNVPLVGNPHGALINKQVISYETLRYAYRGAEIAELLKDVPDATIVEIGSGIGGEALQNIQLSQSGISKYISFDIPEVTAICSYFLMTALPDRKFRLYGEGPVSSKKEDQFDIGLFPHFAAVELSETSVDLFYNSCSFSEMDREVSGEWMRIIEKSGRKYVMHVNHDKVLKFNYKDGTSTINTVGSKLVPDQKKFKRIFKKPRLHGYPKYKNFEYFHYLYERVN